MLWRDHERIGTTSRNRIRTLFDSTRGAARAPAAAPEEGGELWAEHAIKGRAFPQVVITLSFLITFGIVRGITYGIRAGWMPFGNVSSGGTHIHHYVWGIGILIVVGFVELAYHPERLRSVLGMLYGVALALVLDEFALLLNLKDVYWTSQGRESIDAVVIAAGLLLLAALLRPFATALISERRR